MNWHINAKGIPAICKATKRICPLGQHYDTEEEAKLAIEKQHEQEFDLLPNNSSFNEEKKRKENLASLVQRISGIKSRGFDYECYASISIAEKLGLTKIAITDQNGLIVNINNGNDTGNSINADVYVDKSTKSLTDYYSKLGLPIKNKALLARVVYYSEDPEKGMLVQSGGPNVLDAAIIKADEVVDIIEVKELEKGAQLPLITLNVNPDGSIEDKKLKEQSIYIQEAIRNVKIQDIDGVNLQLDFGSDEGNKKAPLYHFLHEYKKKGATSFIYTTEQGTKINKIDLTGPEKEVVKEMIDKGIEANVILRGNLHKQNVNEGDIQRFNALLTQEYFKTKRSSKAKTFTLQSIKEDKITKSGEYVRVGGYILPIKYENYKDNLHKRIDKASMKAFKFSLTGNIKTNY